MKRVWYIIGLILDALMIVGATVNIIAGSGSFDDYFTLIGLIVIGILLLVKQTIEKRTIQPGESTENEKSSKEVF